MKNFDIVNKKLYLVLISGLFFVSWVIGFFTNCTLLIENITLFIVGILVLCCLIFTNNINNIFIFILLIPFMFARPIDPVTIPIMIYVACACLVIGLVVHYCKNRPKIKIGTLFYGLCALGIGMILGGINIKSDFRLFQIGIMSFVVVMFLLVYIYFVSCSKKVDFENIAFLMTILGVFISAQSLSFFLSKDDFMLIIVEKLLVVGWGVSNNIALMLLFTIPFTFYLFLKNDKLKSFIYLFLVIFQSLILIFTHSRGGIVAFACELLLMLILSILIFRKNKKMIMKIAFPYLLGFISILLIFITIYFYNEEYFDKLITSLKNFNFETLNGRLDVYKDVLKGMGEHAFFGKGVLFSLFEFEEEGVGTYLWGHSTILQTFTTMGILGTLALFYHFFEKYFVLLKRINYEKVIIFLGLFGSGLYGLVDVSYYFINYMIVLVLIFILCEPYFYNWKLNKETKLIKTEKTLDKY